MYLVSSLTLRTLSYVYFNTDVYSFFIEISGLPADYQSKDWKPPSEPPCIIKHLCDRHEGLEIEAKVIKEHWWKPHVKKLFEKRVSVL